MDRNSFMIFITLAVVTLYAFSVHASELRRSPPKYLREEALYEGKRASEWVQELRAGNTDKAKIALAKLGQEAIVALAQLIKEKNTKTTQIAVQIILDMKQDKDTTKTLMDLVKDESFEVRRTAVKALAPFTAADSAVASVLKDALKDRDKSVAEAAVVALSNVTDGDKGKLTAINDLLDLGERKLSDGDVHFAMAIADEVRLLEPENFQARKLQAAARATLVEKEAEEKQRRTSTLLDEARRKLDAGDYHVAAELALEAKNVSPNNEQASEVLNKAVEGIARAHKKAYSLKLLAQAVACFNQTDFEQSRRVAQEALSLDPGNSLAQEILRRADKRATEDRSKQLQDAEVRARDKKVVINQYLDLAESSLNKSDFDLGLMFAREACALDPTHKQAYELLKKAERLAEGEKARRKAEEEVKARRSMERKTSSEKPEDELDAKPASVNDGIKDATRL
jgi:hypothetical protein